MWIILVQHLSYVLIRNSTVLFFTNIVEIMSYWRFSTLLCFFWIIFYSNRCALIGRSSLSCMGVTGTRVLDHVKGGSAMLVSPSLMYLPRTLLLCRSSQYVYLQRRHRSFAAVLTALLLIAGVEPNPGPTPSSHITLGSLNVRSVIHKSALVHSLIVDESLDILALTETWTATDDPPAILKDVCPAGYHVLHRPRPGSCAGHRGGGLAVIATDRLAAKDIYTSLQVTSFEAQCVKLSSLHCSFIIINVYRPPHSPPNTVFFNELTDLILEISNNFVSTILICGDLNCPGVLPDTPAHQLSEALDSINFTQYINQPTRLNNLLDIFATDSASFINSVSVLDSGNISDHSLIKAQLQASKQPSQFTLSHSRSLKNVDFIKLDETLCNSELLSNPASNTEAYVQQINMIVNAELDLVAPLRTRRHVVRVSPIDAFLSPAALAAKRNRRKLERVWLRTNKERDRLEYRAACRLANKLINESRATFLSDRLRSISSNSRNKWRAFNNLLHNKLNSFSRQCFEGNAQDFCNKLSRHFCDKISRLHAANSAALSAFQSNPFSHDSPLPAATLSLFQPVTQDEVSKLLHGLHIKFSPVDTFPSSVIKSCPRSFSRIITILANLSFSEGTFPSSYKSASITPLLKKPNLDPEDLNSYRPISNLNTLSKILERLALERLQPFIIASSNFNPLQSAYRKFHSTETCILKSLSDIYKAIDSGSSALVLALDLSAAFDTVCTGTLLKRLELSFGINSTALAWISSYLSCRSQYVSLLGFSSSTLLLSSGVPQGSVLGPLFFAAYTSPVHHLISSYNLNHQQYADDTQIYISLNKSNHSLSIARFESCLMALRQWFLQNHLCINPSKSEAALFSTSQRLSQFKNDGLFTVTVDDATVLLSDTIVTLGVTLDSQLTLTKHVNTLVKACYFNMRAIRHIRHLLSQQDAALLASALIHSKLDYCNSILFNTSAANLHSLQRVQHSLARLVLLPTARSNPTDLLRQLHWLPVPQRINYKIACLTHSSLYMKQPAYLNALLQPHAPPRSLRSSSKNLLHTPRTRLHLTDRSFHISAPLNWNSLPDNVRHIMDPSLFKRSLKTHLFDLAFSGTNSR